MAEQVQEEKPNLTYTARLHLVGVDTDSGVTTEYRTLEVPNLERPHLEAVQAATIVDPENKRIRRLSGLKNLFVIDFPASAHPFSPTPDWLSHEKLELYEKALALGEINEAASILKNWIETHTRSTHFVTDRNSKGWPTTVNAHKFSKDNITPYFRERVPAFTFGPGRKNRTPAISQVIALTAREEGLRPAPEISPSHVDRRLIALFQLAVADSLFPESYPSLAVSHPYLLSSYDENGYYIPPTVRAAFPWPSRSEAARLRRQDLTVRKDKPLTREAMAALLKLRVHAAFPDPRDLLLSSSATMNHTDGAVEDEKQTNEDRLRAFPTTKRDTRVLDSDAVAVLATQWAAREKERNKSVPKNIRRKRSK